MLSDYFDKAVNILSAYDKNLHTEREYAMAFLYGLNTVDPNCPADMKSRLDAVFNNKMQQYNISSQDLNTFNQNNLNAKSSEKLPNSGCN